MFNILYIMNTTTSSPTNVKTYLTVPFERKSVAKDLGCWWDSNEKMWYIPTSINFSSEKLILDKFERALNVQVILNVKFHDRHIAKKYGAKWSPATKQWYLPKSSSVECLDGIYKEMPQMIPNYMEYVKVN